MEITDPPPTVRQYTNPSRKDNLMNLTVVLTVAEADALATTLGIARTNLKSKSESSPSSWADGARRDLPLITSIQAKLYTAMAV